jgi:PAS domain S-box-containing protein
MKKSDKSILKETHFFKNEPMFLYDYYSFDIVDANDVAIDKYGYSRDELIGKKIADLGEKFNTDSLNGGTHRYPDNIWVHHSKSGDQFFVQFTLHQIKYEGRTVQLSVAHDITHHMDTLATKLHELPRVDTMKATLPMATIEWDQNANVRDWSGSAQKMFGWKFIEIVGKNLFDIGILPDNLKNKAEENIQSFIQRRQSYFTINSEHVTKGGEKIFCTWHNAAVYDQGGKLLNIYSVVEDITEKKLAEEQLKESEQRFRVLSEASLVGVYMIQDQEFKYVNPRLCELSGFSKSDLLNSIDPFSLIHPSDKPKLFRLRDMWKKTEIDSFEIDCKAFSKGEKLIHVKVYGSKILLGDKPAVIGVVVDQTKQVEANEKYKISVDSYRDLFDSIGDSIYIQDRSGNFIEVNKTALQTYGYSRNEILGKDPSFLAAPGKVDFLTTQEHFEKALAGEQQRFEWWGKRKNGEIFPKEIHLNPGTYFGEKVVIAISRDITDQYEQQQDLKQNEQLFRQLFQNAPIGITLLDEHKEIQMVNEGFEQIFGYSFDEIKGLAIDSVIAPDDKIDEARILSDSQEPFEITSIRRRSDGSFIDVLIYGVPVSVEGKTIAIYGIYVDITDRKKSEQQVRQSLKEKEVLLAEIHHRVKNNLAVITGLLELQSHRTTNKDASKALKDSQMRINSMALIHEKLYQNETLSRIDFDVYVKDLAQVINQTHTTTKDISFNFETEKIQFAITQAIPCGLLLNEIVTNSFKHAFENSFTGKPQIDIQLKSVEDGHVLLKISDNGIGLPGNFDEIGKESLGFTLIKTLVKQIGAKLEIDTENGTSFTFTFKRETSFTSS